MGRAHFEDKAATLAGLEGRLSCGRVLPQATITHARWIAERTAILRRLLAAPWAQETSGRLPPLIVRSSAIGEDGAEELLAGHFLSIQDVQGGDALADAIDQVFRSYEPHLSEDQKVLVQPMLAHVVASGVATSREVGSGRPYIVVNTSFGADTTQVTAGRSNETQVCYHFRGSLVPPAGRCGAVVRLIREIERLTDSKRLDIEFAFVEGEHLPVLLQARPLVNAPASPLPRDRHCRALARAERKIDATLGAHPLASGRRSALGVMPDWNPAEIVGVRPRPLALSLYRNLVTDDVWARQRTTYGYRDLLGVPLLIDILGLPYIDVRASFDSFVPAALSDQAAERLVDHYMDRLLAAPALHDKIEFEIVLSCYAFDTNAKLRALAEAGFGYRDLADLRNALHALTRRVIDPANSPRLADRAGLEKLQERRARILASPAPSLSRAHFLLEDCKRFGTRPFAGLARVGFIAIQLLNSMVAVGAIGEQDRQAFLMSVSTIATEMQRDLATLGKADFLAKYGHLRPGAYDILSPRYDEGPEVYFNGFWSAEHLKRSSADRPAIDFDRGAGEPASDQRQQLWSRLAEAARPLLVEHDFDVEPMAFLTFLADGVREREQAKFEFTRSLSDALALIKEWGASEGLSAEDLSFADVAVVREAYSTAGEPLDLFADAIRRGRERYEITSATCLPPLIVDKGDVWGFELPVATPNFVTNRSVRAPVIRELEGCTLTGAIVMIPNADPGFDWIFSRDIAGLVTAYGGANSHMAIRAAELDLPAVIGAGDHLYGEWSRAGALFIDCANRRVDIMPTVNA